MLIASSKNRPSLTNPHPVRVLPQTPKVLKSYLAEKVKDLLCHAPQASGGVGVDAYAGLGGTISGGGSFNPSNGQISIGFDLGVGVGLGGGTRVELGKNYGIGKLSSETSPLFGAGVNLNATGVIGASGATYSRQVVGSNVGDWSAGYTGGAEASLNANVSIHVQLNLPALYNCGATNEK